MPHIHVGHNIPGYLPESDVACFSSIDTAIEFYREELRSLQGDYYERCEGHCSGCAEFESCGDTERCEWCSVAADVEAALSSIADGNAKYALYTRSYVGREFAPPEGASLVYWMKVGRRTEDCELNADFTE